MLIGQISFGTNGCPINDFQCINIHASQGYPSYRSERDDTVHTGENQTKSADRDPLMLVGIDETKEVDERKSPSSGRLANGK